MGCGASTHASSEDAQQARAGRILLDQCGPACERVDVEKMQARYKKGQLLGRGSFGECHEAYDNTTGEKVCVKSIFKKNKRFRDIMLEREAKIMLALDHPGVVQLLKAYEADDVAFLIFELMKGGDLLQRCIDHVRLSAGKVAHVCKQAFEALAYVHGLGICHRDIKPENFMMISSDPQDLRYWDVKLTDFGLSCSKNTVLEKTMSTLLGTPEFAAPEVLKISKDKALRGKTCYSCKIDVWAAGVLAYTMLSGKNPFNRHGNLPGMIAKIIVGDYHFKGRSWAGVEPLTVEFVTSLMKVDPDKRPHAHQVLTHPFLRVIDSNDSVESSPSMPNGQTSLSHTGSESYISSSSSRNLSRHALLCNSEFSFSGTWRKEGSGGIALGKYNPTTEGESRARQIEAQPAPPSAMSSSLHLPVPRQMKYL